MTIDINELRAIIRELVRETIEGGDDCAIQDLIAHAARAAGVPYEPIECQGCGEWASDAPLCARCSG